MIDFEQEQSDSSIFSDASDGEEDKPKIRRANSDKGLDLYAYMSDPNPLMSKENNPHYQLNTAFDIKFKYPY